MLNQRHSIPVTRAPRSNNVNLSRELAIRDVQSAGGAGAPVYVGADAETGQEVFWNPDPQTCAVNPHVLILGESGFGKTYTVAALLAELARQQVTSIVFDYGQGFSQAAAPREFVEWVRPTEIDASREGIAINPLQIFPFDTHGSA